MKKLLLLITGLALLGLGQAQVGEPGYDAQKEGWTKGQMAMLENGFAGIDGSFTFPFEIAHEPDGLFPSICFELDEAEEVYLAVVDGEGYPVDVLVDGYLPKGCHEIIWNNEDFPDGCYLLKYAGRNIYAVAILTILVNPEATTEL